MPPPAASQLIKRHEARSAAQAELGTVTLAWTLPVTLGVTSHNHQPIYWPVSAAWCVTTSFIKK